MPLLSHAFGVGWVRNRSQILENRALRLLETVTWDGITWDGIIWDGTTREEVSWDVITWDGINNWKGIDIS